MRWTSLAISAEASVSPGWPVKCLPSKVKSSVRGAVDEAALVETEAGHDLAPWRFAQSRAVIEPKISCVCVLRSTTSQERQPPE